MFLFIFDSLSSEVFLILVVALIFFGPRRLPQISRQIGKSLAEFRRASEDFKRTWEREVALENLEKGIDPAEGDSILDRAAERIRAAREAAGEMLNETVSANSPAPAAQTTEAVPAQPQPETRPLIEEASAPAGSNKHEWR